MCKWRKKEGAWRSYKGRSCVKVESVAGGFNLSFRNEFGAWKAIMKNSNVWPSRQQAQSRGELLLRQISS